MSPHAVLTELTLRGVRPTGIRADSRLLQAGELFIALPGAHHDGRAFIADAVARGACAVLHAPGTVPQVAVPCLPVANLPQLAGPLASLLLGEPSHRLWLCGVTGTNGKTSVSHFVAQIMNAWECKCALIGTLGYGFPPQLVAGANTTPDAVSLQHLLAGFVRDGATSCAMEVSSIGLDQSRVDGVAFDVAIFTNLSRDHLEYHGSMAAYAAAKRRLFEFPDLGAVVINLDDAFGRELAAACSGQPRSIGYTLEGRSGGDETLAAEGLDFDDRGLSFRLRGVRFHAPLIGRFNAANLLATIGALYAGGETLPDIAEMTPRLAPPAGRLQTLGGDDGPLVIIDYAHSPDALEKALTSLRETATRRGGKLVCVFGCGGERDAGKRPQMGAIAEALAESCRISRRDQDAFANLLHRANAFDACVFRCIAARETLVKMHQRLGLLVIDIQTLAHGFFAVVFTLHQRLAGDVLGDHQQRLVGAGDLLQQLDHPIELRRHHLGQPPHEVEGDRSGDPHHPHQPRPAVRAAVALARRLAQHGSASW